MGQEVGSFVRLGIPGWVWRYVYWVEGKILAPGYCIFPPPSPLLIIRTREDSTLSRAVLVSRPQMQDSDMEVLGVPLLAMQPWISSDIPEII